MAYYTYIFADLLTNNILIELPLESVTFGSRLGKAGNFQASFGLNRDGFPNKDVLDSTIPGRTAIYVERKDDKDSLGQLVWGGILWSRTWQEQAYNLQFTAQSFESFAHQADLRVTLDYSAGVDQRFILGDLWTQMQSMASRNLNVIVPTGLTGGPYTRNPVYFDYEAWTFGKLIENLQQYSNSPDYYIGVRYNSVTQNPEKFLVIDNVLGITPDVSKLYFDYPGSIRNYWWPENASNSGVSVNGVGAGEGAAMLRGIVSDSSKLNSGWPDLVQMYSNKDTSDSATLNNQILGELSRVSVPITIPTFQINSALGPKFGDYKLGDYAIFTLESSRWANLEGGIKVVQQRIIGWDVTPSSSSGMEDVKLILTGQ